MDDRDSNAHAIRLVIADVDGTLVTPDKVLTSAARRAAENLSRAGILLAITSGRPPAGMTMLIDALRLKNPSAAFNGGLLVRPDLSIIREHLLPPEAAERAVQLLNAGHLSVWVYTDRGWFVLDRNGPHVEREEFTVKFPPVVVPTFGGLFDRTVKIVGVSDDHEAVARGEAVLHREFGEQISASRSQPYYLDITHPDANKGTVVQSLSELLSVPPHQIASIGDMPNDILMFKRTGMSIAMGNADPEVKLAAQLVTKSNTEDGFAFAVEHFILPSRAGTGDSTNAA